MAAQDTFDIALELVQAGVSALALNNRRVPARQFVSMGEPPVDECCAGLIASYPLSLRDAVSDGPDSRRSTAETYARAQQSNAVMMMGYALELWWCYPTIKQVGAEQIILPEDAEITAATENLMLDAEVLYTALRQAVSAGQVLRVPGVGTLPRRVSWGGIEPLAAEGGCAGVRITCDVEIRPKACGELALPSIP